MSGCQKLVIKLSLGSRLRCSSMDEVRGIICCLREDQMLEGGLKKKTTNSDAVKKKQKHLSYRQLHSQMSQDRQAGCSYLILSTFCWLYFCSDCPQDNKKVKMRAFFNMELSDCLPKPSIITPQPTRTVLSN